jgi:hypothetical protein
MKPTSFKSTTTSCVGNVPEAKNITFQGTAYGCPFSQLLRPLTTEERNALVEEIRECGIVAPVVIDEASNIIDGKHRMKIAVELGLPEVPMVAKTGLTDEQKRGMALGLNVARRHLSPGEQRLLREQRLIRVAQARNAGDSLRAIAQREGVSESQVRQDIDKATAQGCAVAPPDHITGRDGKKRRQPRRPAAPNGTKDHRPAPKPAADRVEGDYPRLAPQPSEQPTAPAADGDGGDPPGQEPPPPGTSRTVEILWGELERSAPVVLQLADDMKRLTSLPASEREPKEALHLVHRLREVADAIEREMLAPAEAT